MIVCVGSINVDLVYRVPHLVRPGETLAARSRSRGLGGKGANQSIAAALAGASVLHCGAVGEDGTDLLEEMKIAGVDTSAVAVSDQPTGHAVIAVDDAGENAIILLEGANGAIGRDALRKAVGRMGPDDILMLQNEVRVSREAAELARGRGAQVVYSAAPFDADAVGEIVEFVDLLILNEVEADALQKSGAAGGFSGEMIVTRGAEGAVWHSRQGETAMPAFKVADVVDTTGAGDCFAGNLVAALSRGASRAEALRFAQAAAAVQVTRPGAAQAMPTRAETEAMLEKNG